MKPSETQTPEEKEATERLLKEAEQGDARAQYILGIMHNEGEGVPQDIAKAKELLNKTAAQEITRTAVTTKHGQKAVTTRISSLDFIWFALEFSHSAKLLKIIFKMERRSL